MDTKNRAINTTRNGFRLWCTHWVSLAAATRIPATKAPSAVERSNSAEINAVMYVVDSSTGQVMASKTCYGKVTKRGLGVGLTQGGFSGDVGGFKKTNAGKAIEQAVDEAVCFLVSMLDEVPWTGTVILVKGSKVYINRGEREGVTVGQTFDVGESVILRDPDTGEVLDQSVESVGTIRVAKVKEKIAICDVVEGSGIRKGMTIGVAD